MAHIRLFLVDDSQLFRDGLKTLLRSIPEAELVGEASDGGEAVRLAVSLQPDVVVMDIRMRGLDGVQATRRILRDCAAVFPELSGAEVVAERVGLRPYRPAVRLNVSLRSSPTDDKPTSCKSVSRPPQLFTINCAYCPGFLWLMTPPRMLRSLRVPA